METILETIRAAVSTDATPEARAAGATACRAILAALESTPGQPLAAPLTTAPSPIASMVSVLRGASAEQLLDLAIARIRAALPAGVEIPAVRPISFHVVPPPKGLVP